VHDTERGRGSFRRVLLAVALLTSRRIPTSLAFVVDRRDRHQRLVHHGPRLDTGDRHHQPLHPHPRALDPASTVAWVNEVYTLRAATSWTSDTPSR
jgi:hypothetical protein